MGSPVTIPTNNPNNNLPGMTNLIYSIVQGEGYGTPGAIPTWANNPGDLTVKIGGARPTANRVTPTTGVAVYPDVQTGVNALYGYINRVAAGKNANYPNGANTTVKDFYTKYSGGGNVDNFMKLLGINNPNATIGSIINGPNTNTGTPPTYTTQNPPHPLGSGGGGNNSGNTNANSGGVRATAEPFSTLTANGADANVAPLVPDILINTGLQNLPWYYDPGLITGNPRRRLDVQPVSFKVLLNDGGSFFLSTEGQTGTPITVELNASMKDIQWTMKHNYNQQRTRTGHHVTMWGMNADIIEGKCTTGVFMNQFGLTDYFSTRTIDDNLKNLVTSGTMFSSTPNTTLPASDVASAQAAILGEEGIVSNAVSVTQTTGNSQFTSIMQYRGLDPNSTSAFRVAAQDAFVEFLSLFKMNGNVWFWNQTYKDSAAGSQRDWVGVQAWSPTLGLTGSQINARNNDVMTRGGVEMTYRNYTYTGYFKTLQWEMSGDNPFQWTFSFTFQVESTLGLEFTP